jgi:tetratricopeptide (TPR) repeat protein
VSGALSDEDREFIDEHLAEGKVFRKYGLVDKAGDQFEAIIARFPDHVEARQELRDVHREKGQSVKAAEQCLALAEIKRLLGDAPAAEAFEEEARALAPQSVPARAAAAPAPASAEPMPAPEPEMADVAELESSVLDEVEEEISISDDVDEAGIEPPPVEEEGLPDLDLGVEDAEEELPHRFLDEPEAVEEVEGEAPPPAAAPEAEFSFETSAEASPITALETEPEPEPAPPPAPLKVAPAKAAPAVPAAGLPADLQKVLDEVEAYVSLGFVDDAKEALREVAAKYPGHAAIQAKIDALGLVLDEEPAAEPRAVVATPAFEPAPEPESEPPVPEPAFEPEGAAAALEPEPFAELGLSEPPPEAEPKAEPVVAAVSAPLPDAGGGIDLGAELSDLFGAQSAVEEPPAAEATTELGDSGLEEIFKEFKKGVDKQLGKEDYDTRYNLGIAYKEMGLIDEAIAEFQLAAKDPNRVLECASMLGICFMDKGMPKLAVKWFEKGLAAPDRKDEEYIALRYDLAIAHQADGDVREALSLFSELYGQDANFRDVASKVRELKAALG